MANKILSIGSIGSILSIGSVGSCLSIGSTGSVLSIASIGSVLSIASIGSVLSIGSVFRVGGLFDLKALSQIARTIRDLRYLNRTEQRSITAESRLSHK